MKRHTFTANYDGERPASGTATKAAFSIRRPTGEVVTFSLGATELRSLHRASLVGLGFLKVGREPYQKDTTWEGDIARKIDPILVVTKALFPIPPKK